MKRYTLFLQCRSTYDRSFNLLRNRRAIKGLWAKCACRQCLPAQSGLNSVIHKICFRMKDLDRRASVAPMMDGAGSWRWFKRDADLRVSKKCSGHFGDIAQLHQTRAWRRRKHRYCTTESPVMPCDELRHSATAGNRARSALQDILNLVLTQQSRPNLNQISQRRRMSPEVGNHLVDARGCQVPITTQEVHWDIDVAPLAE